MNYREEVLRTAKLAGTPYRDQLSLGCLGLAGEAGEVIDLIKKHLYHGKELDIEKVKKELGDVHWYLEYLGASLALTTEEIQAANVAKLRARFPDGFSHEAANAKADESGGSWKDPEHVKACHICNPQSHPNPIMPFSNPHESGEGE